MSFKGGKKKKLFIGGIVLILIVAMLAVSLRFCLPSRGEQNDQESGKNQAVLKEDVIFFDEDDYEELSSSVLNAEPLEEGLRRIRFERT